MIAAAEQGNSTYFKDYFHQIRETLAQWEDLVARLDAYGRFVGYDPVSHTPPPKKPPSMAAGSSSQAVGSSQARVRTSLLGSSGTAARAGPSERGHTSPLLSSSGAAARAGPSRTDLTSAYFSSPGLVAPAGPSRPGHPSPLLNSSGSATWAGLSRPGPSTPSSTTSFGLYKPKGPQPLKRVTSPPSGPRSVPPPSAHNYPPPQRLLQPLPNEPRDLESSKRKTLVKDRLDEPPRQPYIPPPPLEGPSTRSKMGKGLKKLGNLFQ